MTSLKFAFRSLVYHRWLHAGALLGGIIASAVLIGALAVGDSVRFSLRVMSRYRLGSVDLALLAPERFFREALADEIHSDISVPVAPLIVLRGTASSESVRSTRTSVFGVDDRFWNLSPGGTVPATVYDGAALSEALALRLKAKVGDTLVVRLDKPSLISRDAPLSTIEDSTVAEQVTVTAILTDQQFGRFELSANQAPALNLFLPISTVQRAVGMQGKANALLVGSSGGKRASFDAASQALWKRWNLQDAGLTLRDLPNRQAVELRTDRVFFDPPIVEAAHAEGLNGEDALTYFVNGLTVNGKTAPYSTASAVAKTPGGVTLQRGEAAINQWLAEDVGAKVGDELTLTYWVVGELRKLEERSTAFRIAAILPMTGDAVDPSLMPDIPGLTDKKNCREWEPGVPIQLNRIRDKDQTYWDGYRGSPKAFIRLEDGRRIWNNRFGDTTTIRYPGAVGAKDKVAACLRQTLNPASLGLYFLPVRDRAATASGGGLDFGGLFIGFSFFLIVAALTLMGMLFAFSVERRSVESGVLLAVGFTAGRVRRLFLLEGAALGCLATLVGTALAFGYTRSILAGLNSSWAGAVAGARLQFQVETSTIGIGIGLSVFSAIVATWFAVRKQVRTTPRALLTGGFALDTALPTVVRRGSRLKLALGALMGVSALGLAAAGAAQGLGHAAETFFGAGALALICGLLLADRLVLRSAASKERQAFTLAQVAARNASRRMGRSVAVIGLLACGVFLVISIGANQHDPLVGIDQRTGPAGGFTLYAESAIPVFTDLNTPAGREPFALDDEDVQGVQFVPMRLRPGDEASCLNLNRPTTPRLFGVSSTELAGRKAFTFAQQEIRPGGLSGWALLDSTPSDGSIPVIGDTNTVVWSLGKGLGQTIDYRGDRGQVLKLRIVAVLANNLLQGSLLMSNANFTKAFPAASGFNVFLIDAPKDRASQVAELLGKTLEREGLEITSSMSRVASLAAVEGTYLKIFGVLGALGMLLGSAGLAVVVLRNVLDRRGELAILRAVGFTRNSITSTVFGEHARLLLLGVLIGLVSSMLAIAPGLSASGGTSSLREVAVITLSLLASGLVWTGLAARLATRGSLLTALRSE